MRNFVRSYVSIPPCLSMICECNDFLGGTLHFVEVLDCIFFDLNSHYGRTYK